MEHETTLRLSVFVGLFALFATIERLAPRKALTQKRPLRWSTNWLLVVAGALTVNLMAKVLPFIAVGAAIDASSKDWGLFNNIALPSVIEVILAIVILDFAIWFQHLITHKIPLLWRFHRVHHADRDIDVTTALRFHPVEIAFSMLLKIGLVYLLGPAAVAVILFEIMLNGTALFNHANIRLPLGLDVALRTILVTPDMHRVHHSVIRAEHNSNYGFALAIWDRIFNTYVAQPSKGHDDMTIGLEWQDKKPNRIDWALALPFFRK
ncbi:MAG: sterol desaturase/sphingolipid hydroxylase (fatty acid hydroxylase superfamily) [Paracoccaceae bacterium]|jgi:sterol desaturase/sphingolipid hydroxylase (fatty acid hydroxylase superfamily)